MNSRDLSELKRRLNPDKRNPSLIRGCYVSPDGEILATFSESVAELGEEDNAKFMAIFKKTLSGTLGQNLNDVDFSAEQIMHGETYAQLLQLRSSHLKDDTLTDAFFSRVIAAIPCLKKGDSQSVKDIQEAANYLILMMFDGYDMPFRDVNDEADPDRGTDVFDYIICSVCPVRRTRSELAWLPCEKTFRTAPAAWTVGMPEVGFLYPAFEERSANVSRALYYTRSSDDIREDFVRCFFDVEPEMSAQEQQETFRAVLEESLGEECSLELMQAVHETVCEKMEEQKADKTADPLKLSSGEVKAVLRECGVSEEKAEEFEQRFEENFGAAELPAVNMIAPKKFNVSAPGVTIQVSPECSHMIETREIDGKRYILVPADGDVEVNGVRIRT